MQYGKCRSYCCPIKLERKFVFHSVTPGLIEYLSATILGNKKRRATIKQRAVDCEISQSGQRRTQINLKIQKCQYSQTLLKIQIRSVPRKWQPGSIVLKLATLKTAIGKSGSDPRLRRLLAGSALAKQHLARKKYGDLITADRKVLNEEGESRNNHRYAVAVQDLATQWILSHLHAKRKLLRRRKGVYESFSSRRKRRKSSILTIPCILANPVKTYHGIIVRLHSINPRRMVLLEERNAESKKGRL